MYETTVPVFKLNLWAERSTCRNLSQSWNIKDLKEVQPGGLPGEAADSGSLGDDQDNDEDTHKDKYEDKDEARSFNKKVFLYT